MANLTLMKEIDSKIEFMDTVAHFCHNISTVGKVKTMTDKDGKITTIWYVWEEKPFLDMNPEDWGSSIALVGKVESGWLKDNYIPLNGIIMTIIGNVVNDKTDETTYKI